MFILNVNGFTKIIEKNYNNIYAYSYKNINNINAF